MSIASSGHWTAVTPSDSQDLPGGVTRGLYVGVAGDVKAMSEAGDTVIFAALAAGLVHPLRVKRVFAEDTEAEDIVAVY